VLTVRLFRERKWFGVGEREGWRTLMREGRWTLAITGAPSRAALAAALPDLPYACGLGTVGLMAIDVTAAPLAPDGGRLPVRAVSPDPDLLAALAAPPDRWAWWESRLRRCHARLAGTGP